jgi:hypothetical protein
MSENCGRVRYRACFAYHEPGPLLLELCEAKLELVHGRARSPPPASLPPGEAKPAGAALSGECFERS